MEIKKIEKFKLKKFILTHNIQTRWDEAGCLLWIPHHLLDDFIQLLPHIFVSSNRIRGMIQQEYVCIDLAETFRRDDLKEIWLSNRKEKCNV